MSFVVSHPFNHPNDEDLSLGTPKPQRAQKGWARSIVLSHPFRTEREMDGERSILAAFNNSSAGTCRNL
jgi:hypothetical protein